MAKNQHQNGVIPGSGMVTGPDDFSDDESTPLTQDYAGRYNDFLIINNFFSIKKKIEIEKEIEKIGVKKNRQLRIREIEILDY